MAEMADALDLGSSLKGCRFDSCYPHSKNFLRLTGGKTSIGRTNVPVINR